MQRADALRWEIFSNCNDGHDLIPEEKENGCCRRSGLIQSEVSLLQQQQGNKEKEKSGSNQSGQGVGSAV
jgi:hypothetical protein